MQVVEKPAPRPIMSISRRNMATGDTSYEGGSSSYIGDTKNSSFRGADADLEEKDLPRRPNPHRKYSQEWFSHAWDQAVEVGKWPRVTYAAVGLVLVLIWIGIMINFAKEETKAQKQNLELTGGKGQFSDDRAFELLLKGTLKKFDPIERTLRVSWGLVFVGEDNKTIHATGQTADDTWEWNLYRDVKAIPEDRQANATLLAPFNLTQAELEASAYRIDNVTQPPIATLGMHPFDSVDTDIDFAQAKEGDAFQQPLFGYPFDTWTGSIVFALTDRKFARDINLNNTGILALNGALLSDSTLNWRIQVVANDTCQLVAPDAGCELHLEFTGRRPSLVKFAAIVAVIVNWTSTISIFLLTSEAVIMRRTYILKEIDILGVCIGALFALPSVRAILPGAPDFGAIIDLIGIIPNIIIVSLCTTAIAISKLTMRRPKGE